MFISKIGMKQLSTKDIKLWTYPQNLTMLSQYLPVSFTSLKADADPGNFTSNCL